MPETTSFNNKSEIQTSGYNQAKRISSRGDRSDSKNRRPIRNVQRDETRSQSLKLRFYYVLFISHSNNRANSMLELRAAPLCRLRSSSQGLRVLPGLHRVGG